MIYITGDTHGDIEIFNERRLGHLKKGDTLIVTGDFGFIWDNSKKEIKNLKKLEKKKFDILFVEGAHENFELLKGYEEALPGAANIIINMATKEQDHRHHMEDDMLKQRCRKQNRGQMYGCGLAVFFAVVALALAIMGHDNVAIVVFGATITAVLIIYVLGKVPEMMRNGSKTDEDRDKSGN